MTIFIGADHRGFALKEHIKTWLAREGHQVIDCGNLVYDREDDYPDYAIAVAQNIEDHHNAKGILICGSGIGMSMTANKYPHIRSFVGIDPLQSQIAVEHDNCNVVCLAADAKLIEPEYEQIIRHFLNARFEGEERHLRRLAKVSQLVKNLNS
jgi:RpiB/LacA/LacB family sugar-phosphate isomerase